MKFVNQKFTSDVTLDYNQFIDCEIRDCTVYYYGGPFSLTRTKLSNVKVSLAGAADATLDFLRMLRPLQPNIVEELLSPSKLSPEELKRAN